MRSSSRQDRFDLPYDLEQLNRVAPTQRQGQDSNSRESRVELMEIMGTGMCPMSEAEQQPGWLAVPRGEEETGDRRVWNL